MKNILITFIILSSLALYSCTKEDPSERFKLLTGPTWLTDSLLANGVDASDPGELLAKFKGEAKFNKNGTGVFGIYPGNWELAYSDTQIIISSDSIQIPLTTQIVELTTTSLKITTAYPNVFNPSDPIKIRMTFNPK
jgi:hypothetical protein